MVPVPEKGANDKELLVLWITWATMFGALFVYIFICHQWGDQIRRSASPGFPLDLIRTILYGITILALVLAHFLRKVILAGRNGGFRSISLKSPLLSNQASFFAKYLAATIVSFALSESIGIYGLVLFFLGDSFRTLYIFIGISALAIFYFRPKTEELKALALATEMKEGQVPGP
jgi:hypothetical protein